MIDINLANISKSYGTYQVLEDVNITVNSGEKIGVIGRNGSGKTTIFKIIAGIISYDQGQLALRKDMDIGYLDQIPEYPRNYSVNDVLNLAFSEARKIKQEMTELEKKMENNSLDSSLVNKYGQLQHQYELKGGYSIEFLLDAVCEGLKINTSMRSRKFNQLSGGEKTTVSLARILLEQPDLLLLDEPTNHLDIDSVQWLENYLHSYSGTVMIISHDRYLLNRLVEKIIEVEMNNVKLYMGNYDEYYMQKSKLTEIELKNYKDQQKKIKNMQQAIHRFREWGRRSDDPRMFKKARNMEKRIERMEKIQKPLVDNRTMNLKLEQDILSGKQVLILNNIEKSYNQLKLLDNINLQLKRGIKICLIGKNGSGKSTLLKIITGSIIPDQGLVKLGSRVKIGYLEQEIYFSKTKQRLIENFREEIPVEEGLARNILAGFLFTGDQVFKQVGDLSGGEKTRLQLCKMIQKDINFLVLDEPTNHLDIESREILEQKLMQFQGTLLAVSHDRYFINKIAKWVAELEQGQVKIYPGNYEYYLFKKQSQENEKLNNEADSCKRKYSKSKIKSVTNYQKKVKKQLENLEIEIYQTENQIEHKQEEIENLGDNYQKIQTLFDEIEQLKLKNDNLINSWIELENELK